MAKESVGKIPAHSELPGTLNMSLGHSGPGDTKRMRKHEHNGGKNNKHTYALIGTMAFSGVSDGA
jgi:hypothetical protein